MYLLSPFYFSMGDVTLLAFLQMQEGFRRMDSQTPDINTTRVPSITFEQQNVYTSHSPADMIREENG